MSEHSSFEDLEREIEKVKGDFYSESGKNTIFKKQQKYDCAKQVVSKIPLDVLLARTCYNIANTDCVIIDYPIMKTYASPEIFDELAEYIISVFQKVINGHGQGKFEVMLNFDGFTISAAERFKRLIEVFCAKCFQKRTGLSTIVTRFTVYNTTSVIDSIKHLVSHLIEENVKPRLFIISKKDSGEYNQMIANYHMSTNP
jgi:hypothetical protein